MPPPSPMAPSSIRLPYTTAKTNSLTLSTRLSISNGSLERIWPSPSATSATSVAMNSFPFPSTSGNRHSKPPHSRPKLHLRVYRRGAYRLQSNSESCRLRLYGRLQSERTLRLLSDWLARRQHHDGELRR